MTLGEICDLVAGGTPSRKIPSYFGGDVPWVKIGDMLENPIRATEESITTSGLKNSNAKIIPAGTVLVSIFATVGRASVLGVDAATNQAIVAVMPKAGVEVDRGYLLHALTASTTSLAKEARGVAQVNINGSILRQLRIPFPPLPEQRRIADILDRADALKRKRQQALQLADDFLRATFLDMFGDLTACQPTSLISLAVQDGIKCGPFGTQLQRSEFQEEGVPLWGIRQLNHQFQVATTEFVTHKKACQLSAYSLIAGDIVMTRKGDVGKCAIYPVEAPTGVMHSDLIRIRLDVEKCDPFYLLYYLHHSRSFAHQLGAISQGAVMAGVNVTKLKGLQVHVAPMPLQLRFRDLVERTRLVIDQFDIAEHSVGSLATALGSDLFGFGKQASSGVRA